MLVQRAACGLACPCRALAADGAAVVRAQGRSGHDRVRHPQPRDSRACPAAACLCVCAALTALPRARRLRARCSSRRWQTPPSTPSVRPRAVRAATCAHHLTGPLATAHARSGALEGLINTAFVHSVDPPSLALIVPILRNGLKDRQPGVKKMAAQVVGSMCALISDVNDLLPYHETLLKHLKASAKRRAARRSATPRRTTSQRNAAQRNASLRLRPMHACAYTAHVHRTRPPHSGVPPCGWTRVTMPACVSSGSTDHRITRHSHFHTQRHT